MLNPVTWGLCFSLSALTGSSVRPGPGWVRFRSGWRCLRCWQRSTHTAGVLYLSSSSPPPHRSVPPAPADSRHCPQTRPLPQSGRVDYFPKYARFNNHIKLASGDSPGPLMVQSDGGLFCGKCLINSCLSIKPSDNPFCSGAMHPAFSEFSGAMDTPFRPVGTNPVSDHRKPSTPTAPISLQVTYLHKRHLELGSDYSCLPFSRMPG